MIARINPKILKWARERNGLSVEELAERIKRDPNELQIWESGGEGPSYTCLEELAYRHLRIPLAVFFFPEPPNLDDPQKKFRRLPDFEFSRLSDDTLHKIRQAQAYQDSLIELTSKISTKLQIFHALDATADGPKELAKKAREYLGISIGRQIEFRSCEDAFKVWRQAVEDVGIYTFKDSFEDRFVSGFCLFDSHFPIIMVNNSNAFARQIFTVAHELGHILLGVNGITDTDDTYIDLMDANDREIEIKCNEFAAELLVPTEEFKKSIPLFHVHGHAVIPEIAAKYSVSKEVILRRLLNHGCVTSDEYKFLSEKWNKEYLRNKHEKPGGNYYLTKLSYLGHGYAHLVFANYRSGKLSKRQAGMHLNVNSKNIDKLERYLS